MRPYGKKHKDIEAAPYKSISYINGTNWLYTLWLEHSGYLRLVVHQPYFILRNNCDFLD